MTPEFVALLWPASSPIDLLSALAEESGLAASNRKSETSVPDLEFAARLLNLEAQPLEISYSSFERLLPKMGPLILRVKDNDGEGLLAILPGPIALAPDGRKIQVDFSAIRSLLCTGLEEGTARQVDDVLERAQVPVSKYSRVREVILREQFRSAPVRGIWLLRLPPSAAFWLQLRQARILQKLALLGTAHAAQYVLWILTWWVVGSNVLNGRSESWIILWAALLLALVPFRVLITWLQGLIAIAAGAKLKQRLLFGALRMQPDSLRHQGAGQLLGRVIESEAVEALALSGGFLGSLAIVELLIAIFVLGTGAGGPLHPVLLILWLAMAAFLARRYFVRNRTWTDVRLAMTHDLVESMVGHRTRLAQLPADQWHAGEDQALEQYLRASRVMDHSSAALLAIVPRGWLVLGLLGLAPAFVNGIASTSAMAIAVGGMLLAYRALKRLVEGVWQLTGAAVAWERVSVLYHSAARPDLTGSPRLTPSAGSPIVEGRELVYRYHARRDPVLHGCNLRISEGDRVVLEGPSGGGKSTLVSLITGLRVPESGQLLVDGFDLDSLGSTRWRERIAAAPQFHENHVLADTFAFNLFMGKRRPPGPADFEQAEAICRELGLDDLLARMPAGMLQMVGETGWQLSHGERSRLYIARALLQEAEVVVLDESFAALDPENLKRVMECVVRRARSLLVIAHR